MWYKFPKKGLNVWQPWREGRPGVARHRPVSPGALEIWRTGAVKTWITGPLEAYEPWSPGDLEPWRPVSPGDLRAPNS